MKHKNKHIKDIFYLFIACASILGTATALMYYPTDKGEGIKFSDTSRMSTRRVNNNSVYHSSVSLKNIDIENRSLVGRESDIANHHFSSSYNNKRKSEKVTTRRYLSMSTQRGNYYNMRTGNGAYTQDTRVAENYQKAVSVKPEALTGSEAVTRAMTGLPNLPGNPGSLDNTGIPSKPGNPGTLPLGSPLWLLIAAVPYVVFKARK